jgi:hypothetical protein
VADDDPLEIEPESTPDIDWENDEPDFDFGDEDEEFEDE